MSQLILSPIIGCQRFDRVFMYALRTYFCAQYLDSSPFVVGSEGASIVTIRYTVACHPLIGVLTTLSQDSRDERAPLEIHLVVK